MSLTVSLVTKLLASLAVIGQITVLVILAALIIKKIKKERSIRFFFLDFVAAHAVGFSFLVALTATLGSLFYSEIAGFEPCKLCWFQRIFMYPMAVILGIAWWKEDKKIFRYTTALSIVGAFIAAYHYLLQIGAAPSLIPCSTVGYSVSCTQTFTMTFGYITIPLMSLTAFLMIFLFAQPEKMLREKE